MEADLERLVRSESPSQSAPHLAATARVLADLVRARLGVDPERTPAGDGDALLWRLGSGPRPVLLLGHYDTVWPAGSIDTHPWGIAVEAGRRVARGPGCFDMKAGLVQAVHAAALAAEFGDVAIILLATPDEEVGSPGSRAIIEKTALGCRAALVFEASHHGALKTARKGVGRYTLHVTGRAAHSGLEPELGRHAGVELAAQVLRIAGLGSPELGTTVVPTRMSAGTTINTVPAAGSVAVDVRAATAAELERVDAALRALGPVHPGVRLDWAGGIDRAPLEAESSRPLAAIAQRVAGELGIGGLGEAHVGGASDGNFTAGAGVPTLDGLGAVGAGAHADDEHVVVDDLPIRAALAAGIVLDLG
ncbi:glutamate carboxypeptidase [Jiangella anatolica]|uniref:Glutamate carboxypeptidase n=2 Tax=Jiangella anatolica TaxID=2670374 RepID=A0A2W2CQ54_9ACTN|nr:glutamate carboxypeptidase [Jiangella anatolica]